MKLPREVVFQVAKGFRGRSKGCFKIARSRAMKALLHSYIMRRQRYRRLRVHWIASINRGCREWNFTYSNFMYSLLNNNILLNRKSLYTLCYTEPISFKALVDESKYVFYQRKLKFRDISQL
ncbi:50S ribosomal protein L20, putative [Plasmodium berghei]|uniref:Ribosomal protein L20 n=6 Tax=Plasmodium (Vinckeia) TaxID=418101 RepID=A0AAE9X046_PLAYO|nr:50S ribosomal protein L20, putative [Plasmodium berghei ANKA]XP_730126.1 50S ribosomal protein L20, putative [Plasmodium yoelii]EAA21691.1 ribosomal protein L20 [Plasmodium yoelii yoelii]ETB56348.1 ribosomal protein L20 [Plasmodium yoelii 17X]CXI87715.1 50S ribosomal protein L20, putative [Plasmodium berghei]WBY59704.1 ribosomal protein L20 [Plasmodium yoelii yoelii]CDU19680.1 50S ribosomal protein L20, putative [Plasmodium yoelii]|eukprot:XP_034423174.1 50S ribosomal protein L20, putative [Plasmodium berghei ANKA]